MMSYHSYTWSFDIGHEPLVWKLCDEDNVCQCGVWWSRHYSVRGVHDYLKAPNGRKWLWTVDKQGDVGGHVQQTAKLNAISRLGRNWMVGWVIGPKSSV